MDKYTENKYKLAEFLGKYNTVIFDMDGVITAEEHYWDSAALTVYQYIHSDRNVTIDPSDCMRRLDEIRAEIFINDKLIRALKDRGVNSNWDLGYVTYLIYIITDGNPQKMYEFAQGFPNILDVYDDIAERAAQKRNVRFEYYKRNGALWQDMRDVFQEWFRGDGLFRKTYGKEPTICGKSGLVHDEKPMIPFEKLKALLYLMHKDGKAICTGTGRPYDEIYTPLHEWGLFDLFKKDGFITYDSVITAEKNLRDSGISVTLTKPAPFMFLKALFGKDYPDKDIIEGNYDADKIKEALVVGDAGADIIAAKAAGFDFAAVLTGISKNSARGYFESMKADYILPSLADFVYETGKEV
ncbi:MAG: HAD hydrolase-like protein [Oscillospiraceae bacterium]|nr:HAD hydrolase-like protein [Oscillospiraceae bacterium]